jgi:hypothetical protein
MAPSRIFLTKKDLQAVGAVVPLLDGLQQAGGLDVGGERRHREQAP